MIGSGTVGVGDEKRVEDGDGGGEQRPPNRQYCSGECIRQWATECCNQARCDPSNHHKLLVVLAVGHSYERQALDGVNQFVDAR